MHISISVDWQVVRLQLTLNLDQNTNEMTTNALHDNHHPVLLIVCSHTSILTSNDSVMKNSFNHVEQQN